MLGDGRKVLAEGTGQIRIRSNVGGKEHHSQNVMFVPKMKANLFSVRSVAEKRFKQNIVINGYLKKMAYLLLKAIKEIICTS